MKKEETNKSYGYLILLQEIFFPAAVFATISLLDKYGIFAWFTFFYVLIVGELFDEEEHKQNDKGIFYMLVLMCIPSDLDLSSRLRTIFYMLVLMCILYFALKLAHVDFIHDHSQNFLLILITSLLILTSSDLKKWLSKKTIHDTSKESQHGKIYANYKVYLFRSLFFGAWIVGFIIANTKHFIEQITSLAPFMQFIIYAVFYITLLSICYFTELKILKNANKISVYQFWSLILLLLMIFSYAFYLELPFLFS